MIKEFPVISYKLKDEDPVLFSNTLGESFKDIGFCSISDHPIDTNLINEIIHSFGSFFELSEETKLRYLLKGQGGARGYTPFKIETAKDSNLPDLKEFWHTGRELPSGHHYEKWMLPNIWIKELPELKDLTLELYSQFDQLGKSLLRSLALYLKLDKKYFDDVTNLGNSVMRTIHYPKVNINEDGEREKKEVRHLTKPVNRIIANFSPLNRNEVGESVVLQAIKDFKISKKPCRETFLCPHCKKRNILVN